MYDPDIIAIIYPAEGQGECQAEKAIKEASNRSRFVPPRRRDDRLEPHGSDSRFIREATEQPEEKQLEDRPRLVLRFSNPPKTRQGLVAGRNPEADLFLGDIKGVSWNHFALTFDDQNCLIVRDLHSTVGTRVIYDGEDWQQGRGVDWSARGPSFLKGKTPVIKVLECLQFGLIVPDHDTTSQTYLDNVAVFRQGTTAAEDLFCDLQVLCRPQTELPTPCMAHLPSSQIPGPRLWKKEIGRGAFALVSYAWDVTSRAEYALKEPRPGKGGNWKREAEIMKGLSHEHIVALKYASFVAEPQLYFEYIPGGSLEAYLDPPTTAFQNGQIALQLLDALVYLHGEKPPIVHRDIKPENVLIRQWSPDKIHVKLADFGLSKQSDILKTFCGSLSYAAPEIYYTQLVRGKDAYMYDPLVDTWSVAVLLVKLQCGRLPGWLDHYKNSGTAWGEAIVRFVRSYLTHHEANEMLSFLLEDMLVVDPVERQPAVACHATALRLFGGETPEPTVEPPFFTDCSGLCGSDCKKSGAESDPATPKALPADFASSSQVSEASEASTIRQYPRVSPDSSGHRRLHLPNSRVSTPGTASLIAELGENGSEYIDTLLGKISPDVTEWQSSSTSPPEDIVPRASVVDGELRNAGPSTEASLEQNRDRQDLTDSVDTRTRMALNSFLNSVVREEGGGPSALSSQRKRTWPGGDLSSTTAASFRSPFTDRDPEVRVEAMIPVVINAQELLAFDEDRLIQFLNDCRVEGGGFDISRVAHVDKLSDGQREVFREKVK
ncbi:MAG: hypothetical protein Q9207_008197 [Kuettlingeria erythrocarpa]